MVADSRKILWVFSALFIAIAVLLSRETLSSAWEHSQLRILLVDDANEALSIGNHYFNADKSGQYDLDLAQKYYYRALTLDPAVRGAWHQLARIDFIRGDLRGALDKINTQISITQDSLISSYYVRGLILGFRKEYEGAEQDFKKFIALRPNSWAAHNDLAWLYFEQGKFLEAEATSRQGLSVSPDNAWLLTMHGMSLFNLHRISEAKADLEKARQSAAQLSSRDWETSYPGNDPSIASEGLKKMQETIAYNLTLVNNSL